MEPPIDKRTFRTRAYLCLRERIMAGELLPGETITLRGLAADLGVSVAPVREALVQLESEKVVLRRDNRDYRVNTLSRQQLDEVFEIRRLLETRLADSACRLRPEGAAEEAARIFRAMREARGDAKLFVFLNRDLHFHVYGCAGLPILLEIVSGLWARIGPYLSINLPAQDTRRTLAIHAAMLASFTRKDSRGFTRALLADMEFSYAYVAPLVEERQGSGTPSGLTRRRVRRGPSATGLSERTASGEKLPLPSGHPPRRSPRTPR
jgi:DNA-binding GntR family transcriptional regulator